MKIFRWIELFYDLVRTIFSLIKADVKEMLTKLHNEKLQVIYIFVNYMLLPLFLMIPTLISMMKAANSFVGEKAMARARTGIKEITLAICTKE